MEVDKNGVLRRPIQQRSMLLRHVHLLGAPVEELSKFLTICVCRVIDYSPWFSRPTSDETRHACLDVRLPLFAARIELGLVIHLPDVVLLEACV